MLQNWSESDTWKSLGRGIQTNDVQAAKSADLSTGPVKSGVQSFDVTKSLQAWQSNPNSNFGWVLTTTSTDGVFFTSSEGGKAPRLKIEFETTGNPTNPTPSTNPTPPTDPTPLSGIIGTDSSEILTGTVKDDIITGLKGDDNLIGKKGNDYIQGGDGNDIIEGGQGKDILTGDSGADIFRYKNINDGIDTIKDFEIGSDRIDISNLFQGSMGDDADGFNFEDSVKFVSTGSGAKVQVNPFIGDDDADGGGHFKTLAVLNNITPNQLEQSQFII